MGQTLLDIKIDEINLGKNKKNILLKNGYDSVASILLEKKQTLQGLDFSSVELTKIKKKAILLGEKHGFGWEKVGKKYGGILKKNEFLELASLDQNTYSNLLKSGALDDLVLRVGVEIVPSLEQLGPAPKFVLKKAPALAFAKNYKTLEQIAKELRIPYHVLLYYSAKGLFDEGRITHTRWNKQWIEENFMNIKQSLREKAKLNSKQGSNKLWRILGAEHRELINEYAEYRQDSAVIFTKDSRFEAFLTKDAFQTHKKQLTRMFYFIICERSGIKNYWEQDGFVYRSLTEEEMNKYNPNLFPFGDLKESDIRAISHGKDSSHTRLNYKNPFLGLFYYTLMRKKEEINEKVYTSPNYEPEKDFAALIWKANVIEEAFEKHLPVNRKQLQLTSSRSVFLDRSLLASLIRRVLENDSGKLRFPLKYAAMFALGFFGIIRPVELWRLRIEHLQPNPKTGLLDLKDICGYKFARITLPKEVSKMGLSPSGHYGILLVPRAVRIVNLYLTDLCRKYPEHKGTGYLFRPYKDEFNANVQYASSKTMFDWISKNKSMFADILSTEQLSHFSSYDTRHTGNNLIVKRTFFNDPVLEQSKQDVAQYHARHKGLQNVNIRHYQEHLTENVYAEVINAALNFPFDEKELGQWEDEMFQRATHSTIDKNQKDDKKAEELAKLDKEISNLNEELKQLGRISYYKALGLSNEERLARAKDLQQKITLLNMQKSKLQKGLS